MTPENAHSDPAEPFRSTRRDHRDETAEDYVEAIASLIDETGSARKSALAEVMGVSHVTVVKTIDRLVRLGLVVAEPRRPVRLTPKGERLARESRERHESVVAFLRAIGVPARQANIDAEGIEHHVSEVTLRALKRTMRKLNSD